MEMNFKITFIKILNSSNILPEKEKKNNHFLKLFSSFKMSKSKSSICISRKIVFASNLMIFKTSLPKETLRLFA